MWANQTHVHLPNGFLWWCLTTLTARFQSTVSWEYILVLSIMILCYIFLSIMNGDDGIMPISCSLIRTSTATVRHECTMQVLTRQAWIEHNIPKSSTENIKKQWAKQIKTYSADSNNLFKSSSCYFRRISTTVRYTSLYF